jgi:hypothetical protein
MNENPKRPFRGPSSRFMSLLRSPVSVLLGAILIVTFLLWFLSGYML